MKVLKAEHFSAIGQKLLNDNQPGSAFEYFRKAAALCSENPRILIPYARCLSQLDETGEALDILDRAQKAEPGNPAPQIFMGIIHYDTGEFAKALDHFNACLHKAPSNQLARNFRALLFFALGKKKEAVRLLSSSWLEHNLDFLSRFCALFEMECRKQELEQSESPLKEEISVPVSMPNPNPEEPITNEKKQGRRQQKRILASAIKALDNKDPKFAFRNFQLLLKQNPSHATATFGAAIALAEMKHYKEARDLVIDYFDRKENSFEPALLAWLGRIYIFLGDFEKANRILRAISIEGPDDFHVFYYLALSLLFQGEKKQALRAFKKSFRLYFVDTLEDCFKPLLKKAESQFLSP